MTLSPEQYLRAVELCRQVVAAHDDQIDGGGTIAGSFLRELRALLNHREGLEGDPQ
jgi:hypothetical protein